MCRFGDRYIIEFSLENAYRAGVDEMIIVVGYKAESIINHVGTDFKGIPIRYTIQWEQLGLVHAIECSKDALENSDFFLFLADEVLLNPRHQEMVEAFSNPHVFALCGVVEVEDRSRISRTYGMIYDQQDRQIFRLIEKPRNPLNNTQGTGNCLFRNEILDYIPLTPINQQRKEKELPDLIQCAVDDGKLVKAFEIGSWYANVNTLDELNLENPELQPDGIADDNR